MDMYGYGIGVTEMKEITDLRDLRENYKLTQVQAADLIGCSVDTVRAWEQGRNKLKPWQLKTIASYLRERGTTLASAVRPRQKALICPECGEYMLMQKDLFDNIVSFSCKNKKCNEIFLKEYYKEN